MKTLTFILSILFIILTFTGACYVLLNNGTVSAGYAVVPMVFALVSVQMYRQKCDRDGKNVKKDSEKRDGDLDRTAMEQEDK